MDDAANEGAKRLGAPHCQRCKRVGQIRETYISEIIWPDADVDHRFMPGAQPTQLCKPCVDALVGSVAEAQRIVDRVKELDELARFGRHEIDAAIEKITSEVEQSLQLS